MQLSYTMKSGGILQGKDKQEIALALYDLSLAPSTSFIQWMQETARRVEVQFGYKIVLTQSYLSYEIAEEFVSQLEKYGILVPTIQE